MQTMMARCCLFVLVLACSLSVIAQSDRAILSGRVTDPTGSIIRGAHIQLVDIDRSAKQEVLTNSAGVYVFPEIRPGRYRMQVSAQGFMTVNVTGVTLNLQDAREQNFKLAVGAVVESITVEASGNLVDVSSAVSTNVDQKFVKELPLNGRSFQTLFQLTPGTVIA